MAIADKNKFQWIKSRQSLAWEPEILISGIVLIGLFQLPKYIDEFAIFLDDWGPMTFFSSNLDELLAAFLKTSIYFLVGGLIANLIIRSIWVVMIGLSFLFPKGIAHDKFRFQPYFGKKIQRLPSFEQNIINLDRLSSMIYAITFLLFMCIIGTTFFFGVIGGVFVIVYQLLPVKNEMTELIMNRSLNLFIDVFGGLYLLDFLTMGWLKRFRWFSILYRPVYWLMSILTLAPIYRNIYYGLISQFNRWKIFAFLVLFLGGVGISIVAQSSGELFFSFTDVKHWQERKYFSFDGYYREGNPKPISRWIHIPSYRESGSALDIFVSHKSALEDSIFHRFADAHLLEYQEVIDSDSLRMDAISQFYRVKVNGEYAPILNFRFFNFSQYKQWGFRALLPIEELENGEQFVELSLELHKPRSVAGFWFYKE